MVLGASLPRAVLVLAMPAVGSMLVLSGFGLVDAYWVGKTGPAAVAAMSAASYFLWSMHSLVSLVDVGTHAHVARRAGERDWPRVGSAAMEGLALCLPVSLASMAAFMALADRAFAFMGASGDVAALAREYFDITVLGLPVTLAYMVTGAIFRGTGDTRTPLFILLSSFLLNAVLDPILIRGWGPLPRMGLAGAALATVGSQALGVIPGILILARRGLLGDRRPALTIRSFSILRIGLPTFVQGFMFCAVYVCLVRFIMPYGVQGLAALGVGHKLEGLNYMVAVGFGQAVASLVGQSLGARDPRRAERGTWLATGLVSAFALLLAVVFASVPGSLVGLFVDDPATIAAGTTYLRIVAISQVPMVVHVVLSGAFSGAGDTLPPMILSVALMVMRIPLAYLLAGTGGGGLESIYWAISLTTVLEGVLASAWFLAGRWKSHGI